MNWTTITASFRHTNLAYLILPYRIASSLKANCEESSSEYDRASDLTFDASAYASIIGEVDCAMGVPGIVPSDVTKD